MTREEVFDIWAPRHSMGEGGWSDWVKPVLFAQIPTEWESAQDVTVMPPPEVQLPNIPGDTAVVMDLPGNAAVFAGLQLARSGWRPVPLYNGVADGSRLLPAQIVASYVGWGAVINVWPIILALWTGADVLRTLPIPIQAPPVFLLDSHRRMGERSPTPGLLDNRWINFPTDFPSARILLERGIHQAIVVTADAADPATDLAHTLLRWQEGGINIQQLSLEAGTVVPITVRRPGMFRAAWYQFLATLGFRRSLLGGFGGILPEASSG